MTARSARDARFLLVKGVAGLGDRMLCVLGAILYARMSQRTLVVDWTDPVYSADGKNVFHRFFRSPHCSPTVGIPETDSIYPAAWRDHLHESVRRRTGERSFNPENVRRELSIDPAKLDYPEDLLVFVQFGMKLDRLRHHFHGPFQALAQKSDAAISSDLLRYDLMLQPEIRGRVDQFKRSRFGSRTVGVHIRYSDYRVRVLAIIKQLNALLKRERDLQIFLATDNLEIARMFENTYSGVISTSHGFADPGFTIHNRFDNPDRTEGAIAALMDMYLLAECDHLIVDTSSNFARVARFLSAAPFSHTIDVATKDKGNRRVRNAITRGMRRVGFSSWAFRLLPKLVPIRKL